MIYPPSPVMAAPITALPSMIDIMGNRNYNNIRYPSYRHTQKFVDESGYEKTLIVWHLNGIHGGVVAGYVDKETAQASFDIAKKLEKRLRNLGDCDRASFHDYFIADDHYELYWDRNKDAIVQCTYQDDTEINFTCARMDYLVDDMMKVLKDIGYVSD